MTTKQIKARLEYLRGEIEAERISYGELAELQDLAKYIEPGDVQLLEWAGVPEGDKNMSDNIEKLPDEINVSWHIGDVKSRDVEWPEEGVDPLTDDECRQVLANVKNNHDCAIGVTWDIIDSEIENIRDGRKE